MNNEPTKITVTNTFDNQVLTLEIPQDSTINDWVKVFKTIMVFQTFTENQVKELFGDRQWEYPCEASDEEEDDSTEEEKNACYPSYKAYKDSSLNIKESNWKFLTPEELRSYCSY